MPNDSIKSVDPLVYNSYWLDMWLFLGDFDELETDQMDDIEEHIEQPVPFDNALYSRLKSLVGDMEVNLDEALSPNDE